MVKVAAGDFSMGANDGQDNERPAHKVTVAAFEIDANEVTESNYAECVKAKKCTPALDDGTLGKCGGASNAPVNCVTAAQAQDYCAWRQKRLPTEEEWEFAARGSDDRIYPWGNAKPAAGQGCWKKSDDDVTTTCAVGSHPASDTPTGIHDMAGNVWEMTSSPFCVYGTKECTPEHTLRGGSFQGTGNAAEIADTYRAAYRSHTDGPIAHSYDVGFRCAR